MKPLNSLLFACLLVLSACATPPSGSKKPATNSPAPAVVHVWLSTSDGRRQLDRLDDLPFAEEKKADATIEIDTSRRYQEMVGFGAAITDASAWLIEQRMKPDQREALLKELFGREGGGIGLSFARLTIGASDFSSHHYSFDDMPAGQRDQ